MWRWFSPGEAWLDTRCAGVATALPAGIDRGERHPAQLQHFVDIEK